MKNKQSAPNESIKDLFYQTDDGFYWFKDIPENAKRDKTVPAGQGTKHPIIRHAGERHMLYRVIHWMETGEWPEVVDHIDRDPTNQHPDNLASSDHQRNRFNADGGMGIERRYTKGGKERWIIRTMFYGKTYHLRTCDTEGEALLCGWMLRELLFPGVVKMPQSLKDYVNEKYDAQTITGYRKKQA